MNKPAKFRPERMPLQEFIEAVKYDADDSQITITKLREAGLMPDPGGKVDGEFYWTSEQLRETVRALIAIKGEAIAQAFSRRRSKAIAELPEETEGERKFNADEVARLVWIDNRSLEAFKYDLTRGRVVKPDGYLPGGGWFWNKSAVADLWLMLRKQTEPQLTRDQLPEVLRD